MPGATQVQGRIAYRRQGEETGRERFELIRHAQTGNRTLRAFCEMDDAGLTRDVTILLDPEFRPLDGFCRVTQHGAAKGAMLFLCEQDRVLSEGTTAAAGRISQSLPTPGPAAYLGLHPLACDALAALRRGADRPGVFLPVEGVTNSISPNGDEGLFAVPVAIEVAYLGDEALTVEAGTFATRRYALRWHPDWPPADLWVTGPDALFVRMVWDKVDAQYELVELTENCKVTP